MKNWAHSNLDIENRSMSSPFGCTNFIKAPVSVSRIHKISCKRTTVVHPNTVHTLKMRIQSRSNSGRVEGIFVPYDNFMATSGIIMKPSWCYANNGLLHLPCVNTTNDPMTIYRNKFIGSFEPIKSAEFGHVSVSKLDKANHDHKSDQINSRWKDINVLYLR